MASLTLRVPKGSALTNQELDDNLQNIINALGASDSTIPTQTGTGGPALKDSPTFTTHIFGGTNANTTRFPSAFASISSVITGAVNETTTNIGLVAEAVGSGSNYGVGLYGVGYATGTLRGTGVTGEGHVVLSGDTGSAIGVRGYSNDTHSGGLNVGLFGDASGSTVNNYALYMNAGNIYSNGAQTWTFSTGGLTLSSSVTAPSFVSTVATGTAPFTVSSSTNVPNLNASSLNGATFASPGAIGSSVSNTGTFTNLTYTGIFTGSTGIINIGSGQIYKTSTGDVGIGTSSPLARLELSTATAGGNFRFSGNNFAGGNFFGTSVNTTGVFIGLDSGGGFATNVRDAGYLTYSTSNAERMRVDQNGNVGVGTISPAGRLDVKSTAAGAVDIRLSYSSTDYLGFQSTASGYMMAVGNASSTSVLSFGTQNTERMRIDSNGMVAVGATPSAWNTAAKAIQVIGAGLMNNNNTTILSSNVYRAASYVATYYSSTYAGELGFNLDGTGGWTLSTAPVGTSGTTCTLSERMRVDQNGNMGIGIAPYDVNVALTVYRSQNSLLFQDIQNPNTGSSAGVVYRFITSNVAGSGTVSADIVKYKTGGFLINNNETNSAAYTAFSVGASERMRIDSSGVTVSGQVKSTSTGFVFPDNSTQSSSGIGFSQTWTNVTASRALSTTYTNSTGRPIELVLSATRAAASTATLNISINGGSAFTFAVNTNSGGGNTCAGSIIVPTAATYNVTSPDATIVSWWELR